MMRLACALSLAAALAYPQSRTLTEGAHRMELVLERLDRDTWRAIDPGLVLAQGDRVRFKFRTNFDGFLYVMNQSTSGTYEQLFPRDGGVPVEQKGYEVEPALGLGHGEAAVNDIL